MFEQYFDPELVKQPAFDITIGGKQVLSLNGRMMGLTLTDNRALRLTRWKSPLMILTGK